MASVGSSVVLHRMGAKKEVVNTFPTYYAWRNWIYFFMKYTPQDEWEKMCDTFLNSVFEVQYEGMYAVSIIRQKQSCLPMMMRFTVSAEKRQTDGYLKWTAKIRHCVKCWRGKQCIYLERGQGEDFSYDLAERILKISPQAQITVNPDDTYDCKLVLCDSVFAVSDNGACKYIR